MEDVIKIVRRAQNPPANSGNAADMGLIPALGRSSGIGNGNPLQYSCLENSLDRGAWWATVHGATKNWTQLSTHTQTHREKAKAMKERVGHSFIHSFKVLIITTGNKNSQRRCFFWIVPCTTNRWDILLYLIPAFLQRI